MIYDIEQALAVVEARMADVAEDASEEAAEAAYSDIVESVMVDCARLTRLELSRRTGVRR